jgi:hypothetical protein
LGFPDECPQRQSLADAVVLIVSEPKLRHFSFLKFGGNGRGKGGNSGVKRMTAPRLNGGDPVGHSFGSCQPCRAVAESAQDSPGAIRNGMDPVACRAAFFLGKRADFSLAASGAGE